jgi:hypothetical protein
MNTNLGRSKIKDPVCGMEIEASSAAATREYEGKIGSIRFAADANAQTATSVWPQSSDPIGVDHEQN